MKITLYYFIALAAGLIISLGVGYVVMAALEWRIKSAADYGGTSPNFVEFVERLVFTIGWTIAGPATAIGMFSWLALKLAANWKIEDRAFGGLLKGFISMALAALGGIVAVSVYGALIARETSSF